VNRTDHLSLQFVRLKSAEEFIPHPDGLTLVLVKNGIGKCTTRATTCRLAPGEILIVNGAAGIKLGTSDKGEFQFWTFSFNFENLLPLFSGNEISLLHNLADSFKTPRIHPANSPLAAECIQLVIAVPDLVNLNHRGHLIRIAAAVLSVDFNEAQTQRSGFMSAEDHMVQVFQRLSPTEFIGLSVGELAEKFSCSRRHLNRLFHQHFGVSVASLRMEMRLLKAMSLLRDPDAKIINVAEQCGFNHLGLFNTCFKRRFGASPGQWRKAALLARQTSPAKPVTQVACPLHANGLCLWSSKVESLAANTGAEGGRSGREMLIALEMSSTRQTGANARPER
jgi:AraC-like DNA-binding protein